MAAEACEPTKQQILQKRLAELVAWRAVVGIQTLIQGKGSMSDKKQGDLKMKDLSLSVLEREQGEVNRTHLKLDQIMMLKLHWKC